jgi:hypothetical protein
MVRGDRPVDVFAKLRQKLESAAEVALHPPHFGIGRFAAESLEVVR